MGYDIELKQLGMPRQQLSNLIASIHE